MILLIDNYDSFTFNLYHFLGDICAPWGVEIEVRRNDALTSQEALAMRPDAILLSPGPCTPNEAGICLPLIGAAAAARVPLMGVCLGHQAIGQAFGGTVVRAPEPVHGKVWDVHHRNTDLFAGLPDPFRATRYHSLVVQRSDLPPELEATAWTEDGLIMGLAHRELPVWGVQFHPESIASQHGHDLLRNFLSLARVRAGVAA
jgi:anthranilate synthase/aminodeoxychorismate synthase-like glutamine amidotransferase